MDFFKPPTINGIPIPYEASIKELKKGLEGPMTDYVVCLRALAWKEDEESFEILKKELQNRDYYKRRAALENIYQHKLWQSSPELVRELLLDHSEYVVKLALNILNGYTNCDVENEVLYAYEFWQENEEIKAACEEYFHNNSVDYKTVLAEHQRAMQEVKERALSDVNCAQGKLIGNWRQNLKIENYMKVVQTYYPDYTKDEVEILLYELLDEGCGYASVVATLIQFYKNKSYDFQKTFGFSMYDNDGNINSDLLLLHFYCLTDCSDFGMSIGQLVRRFQKFMRKYSIKGKMKLQFRIDPDALNEKNTYFLVMTRNCVLIDERRKKTYLDQWHYMNLNSIDKEGTYFVTSWGENYMLRKADMGDKFYYVQIIYED